MTSSQAHDTLVKAAQKLSDAREKRALFLGTDPDTIHGQERVDTAKEAYNAAFKVYTNPFSVVKSVDARWPNVPD